MNSTSSPSPRLQGHIGMLFHFKVDKYILDWVSLADKTIPPVGLQPLHCFPHSASFLSFECLSDLQMFLQGSPYHQALPGRATFLLIRVPSAQSTAAVSSHLMGTISSPGSRHSLAKCPSWSHLWGLSYVYIHLFIPLYIPLAMVFQGNSCISVFCGFSSAASAISHCFLCYLVLRFCLLHQM